MGQIGDLANVSPQRAFRKSNVRISAIVGPYRTGLKARME